MLPVGEHPGACKPGSHFCIAVQHAFIFIQCRTPAPEGCGQKKAFPLPLRIPGRAGHANSEHDAKGPVYAQTHPYGTQEPCKQPGCCRRIAFPVQ